MLNALGKNIVIKPDVAAKVTAGGILLPDKVVEKAETGTVVTVGGALDPKEFPLTPGDRVMFAPFGQHRFKVGDTELIVMTCDSVLAKIV